MTQGASAPFLFAYLGELFYLRPYIFGIWGVYGLAALPPFFIGLTLVVVF